MAWAAVWPGYAPLAHTLRTHPHWLRFHSLPQSKRYAQSEAEYAEILHRHRTVMSELAAASDTGEVVLVTCSWSWEQEPASRTSQLEQAAGPAEYWMSVPTDDTDPDGSGWTHLHYQVLALDDPRIDAVLRLAADDVTAGVMLLDPALAWLYHPYDGGADLYPTTAAHREQLRHAHSAWLSSTASGL